VVYVPGSTLIQPYAVDPVTGALSAIGAGAASDGGDSLVVHPNGHFLYLANRFSNGDELTGFAIAADGSLSALSSGFPIATGQHSAPFGPQISPDGTLLAVPLETDGAPGATSGLAVYRIDASTGALTPAPGSPYAIALPERAAFTPDGKFLYVTTYDGPALVGFAVNASDATLTPLSSLPSPGGTNGIAVDPTGRFLYVSMEGFVQQPETITYAIAADGSLTETARLGYDMVEVLFGARGTEPVVASTGADVVNAAAMGGTVSPFTTTAAGQLTSVSNPPAVENGVAAVASNDGKFLYVLSSTEGIHAYAVGSLGAGTLAELSGSPTTIAGGAAMALAPNNAYLHVVFPATSTLRTYSVGTDGSLTPYDSGDATTLHLSQPSGIAVHPTGRFLWIANAGADNVGLISLNVGYATYQATLSTGAGSKPTGVTFSPDGEHGLVTLAGTGQVASYRGFSVDDTPSVVQTYAAGTSPLAVVADGSSRYVYVTDSGTAASPGSAIRGFSMTPTSAVLMPLATPTFASGERPVALAADPAGQYLLAACAGVPSASVAGALSAYTVEAGGLLTPIAGEPAVGSSPVSAVITAAWH